MTSRALTFASALVLVAGLSVPVSTAGAWSLAEEGAPASGAAKVPAGAVGGVGVGVRPQPMMVRFPAISKDRIAFVYGNDLWTVSRTGGVASPLSTRPGRESFPRFSPDGQTLAYVASYDGNSEIYTLPVAGGEAVRVTYHPSAETPCGWTPDGKILFIASGMGGLDRQTQLFTVAPTGGQPQRVPVAYGAFGSFSSDGKTLAFTLHSTDNRTWKRYRGGMATDVWLFNLETKASAQITDWEGTDTLPMWHNDSVYYLSDAGPEHRLNVWSYDTKTRARKQVTKFADDDVRWPSVGPGDKGQGEIIFQLGSSIQVLDLATGSTRAVEITIPGDRPTIRARSVDASRWLSGAALSPSAKRVVVSARGDLWSVPTKEGVSRNLTLSSGVFERSPAWSPNGKWIAYFSDESGEYELWVRASDAKKPEEKADEKKEEGKPEAKPEVKADAKGDDKADEKASDKPAEKAAEKSAPEPEFAAPTKLTSLGAGFRSNISWSPDSKHLTFTDQNGRLYLTTLATGQTKEIDKDPWMSTPGVEWSADSTVLVYQRSDEGNRNDVIWLYNVADGSKRALTTPMFDSGNAVLDPKGEWLYFSSARNINTPVYSEIPGDLSWIYGSTQVLLMAPLRKDVKSPFLPKSDEEEIKVEKKAGAAKGGAKGAKPDDKKADDKKSDDKKDEAAAPGDAVSGTWRCSATGPAEVIPGGRVAFVVRLKLEADGRVSGRVTSVMGTVEVTGTFDKATGALRLSGTFNQAAVEIALSVQGESVSGTWSVGAANGPITGQRTAGAAKDEAKGDGADKGEKADADAKKDEGKKDEGASKFKIDTDTPEAFEARAIVVPVSAGSFGAVGVTHDGKLLFVRRPARGGGGTTQIKIFDPREETPEEKLVADGGGFQLTSDGKKLLVGGGNTWRVLDAAPGGGKAQSVSLSGLRQSVDPRAEWKQIFNDAWRLSRDYFYEPTMHGVDWPKVRDHYAKTLDDAVSREDVQFIIGEMISELNVGHAYTQGPGDVEGVPSTPVGLLGADFELVSANGASAYKVANILAGGPWDTDARGPLSQPGVDVKVGDYILAVNGVAIDTTQAIYAAFVGTADRTVALTVSASPTLDGKERTVLVRPVSSESNLRYRAWIEANRKSVFEKSGGTIGYIYVPNTGQDGQSDLVRQFFGQRHMAALLIDERWNGGGQIPTRFIELLNRPRTNYWARRDGKDWPWPTDSHQGPKAMLINGLAGSGGDMFPWLFKFNNLGKLVGTRTWGGLVGISGNPSFIDGGSITVPTFGFYKKDGTWGIEGHGVDPDIKVIDDPALLAAGVDPQIDAAIAQLKKELAANPYTPPTRPASPDRKGMGIPERDR
jgi:tricorn protease-like protein/C-terminal processing protease CtpA/Prc